MSNKVLALDGSTNVIMDCNAKTISFTEYGNHIMSLSIDEFDEILHLRLLADEELTSDSADKSKVVYFKDGSHIIIEDGATWEYENDPNWLKTLPKIEVIMNFFKKVIHREGDLQ